MGLDSRKMSSGFANNKGTDLPAHLHSLISSIVIPLLESIISKFFYKQNFNLLANLCSCAGLFGNP